MNIVILTPVRILGDGLAACFSNRPDTTSVDAVNDIASLRDTLAKREIDVILGDVSQGVDLYDIHAIAAEWSAVVVFALSLHRPVALVGNNWRQKWPVDTRKAPEEAASNAMKRVGTFENDLHLI